MLTTEEIIDVLQMARANAHAEVLPVIELVAILFAVKISEKDDAAADKMFAAFVKEDTRG